MMLKAPGGCSDNRREQVPWKRRMQLDIRFLALIIMSALSFHSPCVFAKTVPYFEICVTEAFHSLFLSLENAFFETRSRMLLRFQRNNNDFQQAWKPPEAAVGKSNQLV